MSNENDLINRVREFENLMGDLIEEIKKHHQSELDEFDGWWYATDFLQRGVHDLQTGFMLVERSLVPRDSRLNL